MFYKCCVLNCKSVRNDVKLHRLPVIKESLARWLSALRHKIPSGIEGSNLHVCHLHFEKRFLTTKLRVKSYGYPRLFTDEEIASGSSSASILDENKENTAGQDHAYCRKRHYDHTYYRSAPLQPTTLENIDNFHQNDGPSTSAQVTVTMEIQHGMSAHNFHQNDGPSTSAQINVTMERQHGMSARLPCKARQRSTRKIVYNTKNLTSECQILYKEYKKSKRQVQYFKRMERAKTFADKLENLLEKMHPFSKRFLWMQLRMITKNKKGRRFNTDEKLLGLSIFKQSPKCYKFLRRIFILPSKTTLNKMISSLKFQVGINPQIFSAIKNEVTSWENNKKYCSLIFDEMALEPSLTYNKSDDKIHGFVELTSIKPDLADHVLCFMLRGVVHKWQQPLAFYFSQGAASATEIKILLKEIVKAVLLTGLTPVALVSDQGASFQSALKGLQMDTREMQIKSGLPTDDTINLSGASVSIIYDPCHLIKGIRNNFLSKDMQFNNKICKWQDIVDVYYTDCQHTSMRLLPKITDEHVIPQKVKKMKVKHCVQVFSHSMSAALSYTSAFSTYADGKPVSSTLKNTADAVEFFNTLFDSVNGACVSLKKCGGNRLKQAVTEKSEHIKFWQDAIKTLEKIRFLLNRKEKIVPSLKNFIITIKSLIRVWQFFQNLNIKIMRPRYFNSDPIENFFGRVRAYNFRNINPDCHTFINTFKSLLITGVIQFHSENFNCEDVPSGDLINVADIIAPNIETCSDVEKAQDTTMSWQTKAVQEKIDVQSGAYTAGWVIRKILKNNKCENCVKSLTTEKDSSTHKWIVAKEYKTKKNKKLTYPAEHAVRFFRTIVKEANEYLECHSYKRNVKKNIKNAICSKYSFDFFNCSLHSDKMLDQFIEVTLRLAIFNWCNSINKILKGIDILRLETRKDIPMMQKKALLKFKKKLKNKKFK